MPVPSASALVIGRAVNIVLKADQRSGRLTTGRIGEILTRGDHPRGIKVRLLGGQVGRVQSLCSNPDLLDRKSGLADEAATTASFQPEGSTRHFQGSSTLPQRGGHGRRGRGSVEPREEPGYTTLPVETNSLEDYVVSPKARQKHRKSTTATATDANDVAISGSTSMAEGTEHPQQMLQAEFPQLDSALIAAILSDHQAVADARKVLAALS